MARTTMSLDGSGAQTAVVGGKAAALDRLIGMGVNVPPTGVLTVEAYHEFVAEPVLTEFLDDVARRPIPSPDRIREEHDEVSRAFLAHPLPDALLAEIEELASVVGRRFRLAVRSSATAEDLAHSSFAGQYDSYLCVDRKGLSESIRLIWASLWYPRVRAYRQAKNIDERDLAMAVVVMRMVSARHAGVIFTVDPGGSPDDIRIEVVEGLAEDLVSGSATPDVVVVPRDGERHYRSELADVFSQLTETALGIEDHFGVPQDIEWAHDGRRLFIVQARPITTIAPVDPPPDPFDSEPMPGATYTPAGVGEMLPGVLPPLLWSINGPLLEEAFRVLGDDMGQSPSGLERADAMIGRFRGRAALNLSMLRQIAARVSGGAVAELERQYFGQVISEESEASAGTSGGLKALLPVARAAGMRRRLRNQAPLVVGAVEEVLATEVDLEKSSPEELLGYRHRLRELAARVIAVEAAVAATAAASFRGLELFLERYVAEEASEWAQRLTSGSIAAAGTLASVDLSGIMAVVERHPRLARLIALGDPPRSAFERQQGGPELLAAYDAALGRSGSAAVYAGATWAENEAGAWKLVCRTLHAQGGDGVAKARDALADLEKRLTKTWKWRLTRVFTGQVVDMRIRLLRGLVADATDFLCMRETTKRALLRLGGEERRIALVMAAGLTADDALAAEDEAIYLSDAELEVAFRGQALDPAVVAERRGAVERAEALGPLPLRFEGKPGTAETELDPTSRLEGWGASPGQHTGAPKVVRDLEQAFVEPGDVLVAHSTDPSWTPLFMTAGAIVVEEGGPLSHAAIVARELGLPAVLHVPGAVDGLEDVAEVTVDGTAGTVVIHEIANMDEEDLEEVVV